ncbi:MAG: GTPase HflX [Cytophagales bacterium]|nr:GTPase HflX [Cytophagales bacterium]
MHQVSTNRHPASSIQQPEKAILVALINEKQPLAKTKEYLEELTFLAETSGARTLQSFTQRYDFPHPKTFVGKGKLNEIKAYITANDVDMVIFDEELSPAQQTNLEKELQCKILDRTALILDIFAIRAKTAQAKTQVELAQMEYLLPRLKGLWTHLERQKGGIGLRGPGEKELETDRRIMRNKISLLKKNLEKIDRQMITQRKSRGKLVRVALVGYTNAGKSTLMNLLAGSNIFAENKLFATVDSTVRKVVIRGTRDERRGARDDTSPQNQIPLLLTDTVGFIRKLPHSLIESFKSTLDEVCEADLLLHVVDVAHPCFEEHIDVVNSTLAEIGAANKPTILVFNKIDLYHPNYSLNGQDKSSFCRDVAPTNRDFRESSTCNVSTKELKSTYFAKSGKTTIFISALGKINIEELRKAIYKKAAPIHHSIYPNWMKIKYE